MLKPIPQENPPEQNLPSKKTARTFDSRKGKRTHPAKANESRPAESSAVINKKNEDTKREFGIFKTLCIKLLRFVKNTGRHTGEEMGDLIHMLQRSVLALQRQRNKILMEEQKKKKRK
jgi:hypothetical protein